MARVGTSGVHSIRRRTRLIGVATAKALGRDRGLLFELTVRALAQGEMSEDAKAYLFEEYLRQQIARLPTRH